MASKNTADPWKWRAIDPGNWASKNLKSPKLKR